MEKPLQLINSFKQMLEKEGYISQPFTYIEDKCPEIYEQNIDLDCIALIIEHNYAVVEKLRNRHNELLNILDDAKNINDIENEEEEQQQLEQPKSLKEEFSFNDYSSYVDVLLFAQENDTLEQEIKELMLKQVPLNSLKFAVYKKIKQIELELRITIAHNPLKDITKYQKDILKLKALIDALTIKTTSEEKTPSKAETKYNVVFIPNNKNQLYIYDDITKYLEQAKEIKIALDKIYSGYVIESKNIKSISAKNEKLYEYKTPTGLRIMFVISGNNIFVSLLFYKDKQRSIKIDALYDESIKRYQNNEELLLSNLNNPNFYLEQAELIGNLYTLLDDRCYSLTKGGE